VRALITGIGGFAGSHLAEYCLTQPGMELHGIVRSHAARQQVPAVRERVCLHQADLTDAAAVARVVADVRPERVFHLAAQASVAAAWAQPAQTLTTNVVAQLNVILALLAHRPDARLLVVGSGQEYGIVRPTELPVRETNPLRPADPYAVSKVAQDLLGLQYYLSHRLHAVRVRPFNHVGPRQDPSFVVAAFARQLAEIEAGRSEPLLRVGNLAAKRDFSDVRDVVRAYWLALEHGQPGEVYNIGSERAVAVQEVVDLLLARTRVPVRVEPDPARMRPVDAPVIVSDCSRLRAATGWQPHIPLAQSLGDVLDDWRTRLLSAE
jgi:GDP-4-dehydro-6-deoxy-D-mannose reductase